jgi:hypothetical protein
VSAKSDRLVFDGNVTMANYDGMRLVNTHNGNVLVDVELLQSVVMYSAY